MNAVVETKRLLKLDLGCGPNKRSGFFGVDSRAFEGVDIVADLKQAWPWEDGSVEEIHASHMLEHFTATERVHLFNQMYRVMIPGAKATIITPYWASNRAYGDPTHQWPPVSEMSYYYLNREWRLKNAPHTDAKWNVAGGFDCDFDHAGGYNYHAGLNGRSAEYMQFAATWFKEAAQDLWVTVTRR